MPVQEVHPLSGSIERFLMLTEKKTRDTWYATRTRRLSHDQDDDGGHAGCTTAKRTAVTDAIDFNRRRF